MATKEFDLTAGIGDSIPTSNDTNTPSTPHTTVDYALTEEEEKDPNKITVSITDPSPVIVLFGAGASGKTMTLVRLTRYLLANGYQVEPDRVFRPSNSKRYQERCDTFINSVNSDFAPGATGTLNFMLIKVMNKYGEPICQILEAPGEHYFNAKYPNEMFPVYINNICTINNPKTWVFIVEKDWETPQVRANYAKKIIDMESLIEGGDKIIFTCHKADKHKSLISGGNPNVAQFFKEIKNQYSGIFNKYENKNPITRLWRKYNFKFVVFSSGLFNKTTDGGETYTPSNDKYPAWLWKSIQKTVKGGWF
jgi:GTPase SAR1 family protein